MDINTALLLNTSYIQPYQTISDNAYQRTSNSQNNQSMASGMRDSEILMGITTIASIVTLVLEVETAAPYWDLDQSQKIIIQSAIGVIMAPLILTLVGLTLMLRREEALPTDVPLLPV